VTFWRGPAVVTVVTVIGGIALLRGVALTIAFWTAFKYMDYSLWIKVPLAALLILTMAYLFRGLYRDYGMGPRN
jgi:hypothetical protein